MKRDSKAGRSKRTKWAVRFADRFAAACISVGGIGTIAAVAAVFLFLASVVVPLFTRGEAKPDADPLSLPAGVRPLHAGIDEYRVAVWTLDSDGALRVFRADNGDSIVTLRAAGLDSLSAASFDVASRSFAVGMIDGSIRFARLQFRTDYADPSTVPEAASLQNGGVIVAASAIVQKTSDGSLRRQTPELVIDADAPGVVHGAVQRIDHIAQGAGYLAAFTGESDTVAVCRVEHDENEFTGEDSVTVQRGFLPPATRAEHVLVAEAGSAVYVIDQSGHATVWDVRDISAPTSTASADLATDDRRVTAVAPLLGRTSVLVGTDDGEVSTWFRYKPRGSSELRLANPERFEGEGAAVTTIVGSARERVFLAGYANGRARVFHATSGKRVLDFQEGNQAITTAAFAPKSNGAVLLTASGVHTYDVDLKYPEVTARALFRPLWYEGYPQAAHVWQSSAGTDDFETKLGLWPLVFGTLKATVYSMLFGVPLALLAAIFTSEFVSPGARPRLKTLIESMASLPSVVLGFLAALVIAPFVQRVVPSVMVAFIVVPAALLLTAYMWQLMPQMWVRRLDRFRIAIALAVLPVAIGLSAVLGPWIEQAFFNGDLMGWLAGGEGGVWGGWFILALPVCAFISVFIIARVTGTAIRDFAARSRRTRVAAIDLGRFALGALVTVGLAAGLAAIASAVGMDPRGSLMGTYVQRNALVVGFVMGFAIIPIIYTIAEDALSAVPDHLRAASLGAGATPWQTAIRIVLPTAMSGLFSAIMIGLGRAVGETMIVLMAAGNTPVLEMNAFSGFRTLSANIAVELPEAVRDSTHYRTLFLAALLLFFMTFVINTVAEVVRMRFRKRSAQI
ncbi:MAG TPA: ABC transporter permease subunit [Candidatus Krumholzibacteria bacterium]|nr:ABC transporter permease subunit [Candidatus Krumholzibacteria bacterium]